ncbi:hypothetical protein EV424DRAFT_1346340 [Suillus variegatus]|nr:hypothetical protein EV424DRAFT_1346340 [Suillus variegatus]
MTPAESANHALNTTLADVQSLMKRCMKFKEADPETYRLSDEIAQRVAKDLKLYAGTATSFSPLLLSCAAIIRQYSKAGTFESFPDWTSVTEDDPRIKTHPRFEKTLGYRPPAPADIPADLYPQDAQSASATNVLTATDPVVPPSAPSTLPVSQSLDNLVTALAAEPELVSPVQDSTAAGVQTPPHLPVKYNLFVAGTKKKPEHAAPQVGNSNKRKADDEDLDAAVVTDEPKSSSKPRQKRKKKFQSADEDNVHTRTIFVKSKATSDKDSDVANDRSFLEVETRPAEWGQDSHVATPWQITCAINGVGVRERMKAKAAAAAATPNPSNHSRMRTPKSRAISKTPAKKTLLSSQQLAQGGQLAPTNRADPKPTARDILQGIQDLGRRLDLLATNERVDALEDMCYFMGIISICDIRWHNALVEIVLVVVAWA